MPEEYEEIDLWELIFVLRKRFKVVAASFLLAVIIAAFVSFFILPPVYESSVVVSFPEIERVGTTVDGYNELAQSHPVFLNVKNLLGFGKDIEALRSHYEFQLTKIKRNDETESGLLTVTALTKTPELSLQYCNAWLESFYKQTLLFMQRKLEREKNLAVEVLNQRTQELTEAEEALGAFDRKNPISLKEAELKVIEDELVQGEKRLRELQMTLLTDQARLEFLEGTLAKERETLDKSAGGTVLPSSSAAGVTSTNVTILNPVYLNISQDLAATRTRLVTNRKEIESLKEHIASLQEKVNQLRGNIISWKIERERLLRNQSEAKKLYADARGEYEYYLQIEPNLPALARSRLVSEPSLPEKPVAPRKKLNIVIAGFLGLFVGVMLVFLQEWYESAKQKHSREQGGYSSTLS